MILHALLGCVACAIRWPRGVAFVADKITCAQSIWELSLRWKPWSSRRRHASLLATWYWVPGTISAAWPALDSTPKGLPAPNGLPRWLRGHGGYALSLAPTIFRFAALPMKISTSDEAGGWTTRSDQPTLLAAFANTPTYGGGMKIAPHAQMDDGQLDVCVIGGVDPFKLAWLFPTVYFGRHLNIREVEYFKAEQLRVETESPLDVY